HDQQHIVLQAALVNILDERGHHLVKHRQADFHLLEDVPDAGVVVPAKRLLTGNVREVDTHDPCPAFDQAPRQQAALTDAVAAVAIAYARLLTLDVERQPGGVAG